MTRPSVDLAAFAGILFVVLLVAGLVAFGLVGTTDAAPAEEWRAAVEDAMMWNGLSGLLIALAGMSLAVFTSAAQRLGTMKGGPGLPAWGKYAGFAWSATFVAGGAVIFTAGEMASYQEHAEGTKTVLILGYLLFVSPIASFLGGLFALGVGLAARGAGWPAWFRVASLGGGTLTLAVTVLGAAGGIGLLGMGPLVLWMAMTVLVVPWLARPNRTG